MGGVCARDGGGGGGEGGREKKRVITQTTIFTHFTPSGSVSQGKKKGYLASTLTLSAPADFV